jgi:3,4-dihydroxy 2-butanone 4-phosphate synthase/GTP cyclohydrolase II
MSVSPTTDIIADMRAGRMVILVDDEDRENEGDLVLAAEHVTPEAINFMARYGRGLICLTLTQERCRQLNLPPMVSDNRSPHRTAFTVSIEAAEGVTTGISAHDRSRTIQAAVARNAEPADLVQPGHIFPLEAQNGGVLVRAGHTEAGCDLAQLAGLKPTAVICEILKDDGTMARLPDLIEFAREHGLKVGTIRDLIHYRANHDKLVECVAKKEVNTAYGEFTLRAYVDKTNGQVHVALTKGRIAADVETPVRVHEQLSILDFVNYAGQHTSFSIDRALKTIAKRGAGVLVLLHSPHMGQEMLAALGSSDKRSAPSWDPRHHGIGAQILRDLGVGKMLLMSSQRRLPSMSGFGLDVCGYISPDEAGDSVNNPVGESAGVAKD